MATDTVKVSSRLAEHPRSALQSNTRSPWWLTHNTVTNHSLWCIKGGINHTISENRDTDTIFLRHCFIPFLYFFLSPCVEACPLWTHQCSTSSILIALEVHTVEPPVMQRLKSWSHIQWNSHSKCSWCDDIMCNDTALQWQGLNQKLFWHKVIHVHYAKVMTLLQPFSIFSHRAEAGKMKAFKLINNDVVAIDKTGEIIREEITTCLSVAYFWCIGLLESGVDRKI